MKFKRQFDNADSVEQLFEVVRDMVHEYTGWKRGNLFIEFRDLGISSGGYIGGLFNFLTDTISVNTAPLKMIMRESRKKGKCHLFYVLLHEYVHSIGVVNERKTRELTYLICEQYFGENHAIAKMALYGYNAVMPKSQTIEFDDIFEEMDRFVKSIFDDFERQISSL